MDKPSKQFKQSLESNNIADALKIALSEAIELEITTWVSDANSPNLPQQSEADAKPGNRMRTRINIVDGDIETEIGSNFLGNGPYVELKDFHLTQVQDGRNIIRQNLESLQQLFSILVTVAQRLETKVADAHSLPPASNLGSLPPSNS